MKKFNYKLIKGLFIILFIVLGLSRVITSLAFSVSPAKILLTLNPGEQKTITINVNNTEKQDLYFIGESFVVKQLNDGSPQFLPNNGVTKNWITAQEKQLIKSQETKTFTFTINIPNGIYPGSYFFGLGVSPQIPATGVGLKGQIVSILNLQVSGQAKEMLQINQWQLNKQKSSHNNYVFDLTLDNKSNVDIDLAGKILIYNWRGKLISSQDQYLGNKMIPNTSRFLQPEIKFSKFSFSPIYRAKIDINYGRLNLQTSSEFLIFNWTAIIFEMILIILGIMVLIFLSKKH